VAAENRERSDVAEHGPCRARGCHGRLRLPALVAYLLRAGHRRSDTRRTAAEGVEALPMGSGMDRLPGTPRGRPGASAIDYEAAQRGSPRGRTVGSKAETGRLAAGVSTRLSGLSTEAAVWAGGGTPELSPQTVIGDERAVDLW
jgi:hypothetical protein